MKLILLSSLFLFGCHFKSDPPKSSMTPSQIQKQQTLMADCEKLCAPYPVDDIYDALGDDHCSCDVSKGLEVKK